MHFEISDTPDKNAPRVIVETPSDAEYCSSRQQLAAGLASGEGLTIGSGKLQEVTPPIPAEVVGLAFLDFEHHRGSKHVATTWELHPAIVTLQ